MESTCARRAHLAVTKVEYEKIMQERRLDPSVFSFSPQLTYFKLFLSQEAALREAFKSRYALYYRGEARVALLGGVRDRYRGLGGPCPGKVRLAAQRPVRRMQGQ